MRWLICKCPPQNQGTQNRRFHHLKLFVAICSIEQVDSIANHHVEKYPPPPQCMATDSSVDFRNLYHNFKSLRHMRHPSVTSGKHVRVMYTPLKRHFYIAKLGYAGVYLIFLFLLQNIDCVLSKNKKDIKIFLMRFLFFTTEKISVYCMGKFS